MVNKMDAAVLMKTQQEYWKYGVMYMLNCLTETWNLFQTQLL